MHPILPLMSFSLHAESLPRRCLFLADSVFCFALSSLWDYLCVGCIHLIDRKLKVLQVREVNDHSYMTTKKHRKKRQNKG